MQVMPSKILGVVKLHQESLAPELEQIKTLTYQDSYSEFTFGTWKSFVLGNGSGEQDDTLFRHYEGKRKLTPLGAKLGYVSSLVEETFNTQRLLWVRIFLMQDGILLPHRDFIEFKNRFTRINVPLQTDPTCLHSQDEWVFHMRAGEVWYLDGLTVHSACSSSKLARLSLCLDFEGGNGSLNSLLKNTDAPTLLPSASIVSRKEPDKSFMNTLYSLSGIINEHNFKDILQLLAKVHFYKKANAASVYDWLIAITEASGDESLLAKAVGFRRYCIEERGIGERFAL